MDTKSRSSHKTAWGIWLAGCIVFLAAAATVGMYPYMQKNAMEHYKERTERADTQARTNFRNVTTQVMNFSYEIWHQEKQEEAGKALSYTETFLPGLSDEADETEEASELRGMINELGHSWKSLYGEYSGAIFYAVEDKSGVYLRSNVADPKNFFGQAPTEDEVQFTVNFSDTGRLFLTYIIASGEDAGDLIQAMNRYEFYDPVRARLGEYGKEDNVVFQGPKNIKILFRCNPQIVNGTWREKAAPGPEVPAEWDYRYGQGFRPVIATACLGLMIAALFLPFIKIFDFRDKALCRLSFEPLSAIGLLWLLTIVDASLPTSLIADTMNGTLSGEFVKAGFLHWPANFLVTAINLLFWCAVYGLFYWGITCYRAIFTLGPWRYFKERTWLGRGLRAVKRWFAGMLNVFEKTDWNDHSNRILGKAVLANFLILALISLLWFWGIGALILYSLALFFFLRKAWGEQQKKYNLLLDQLNQIAEGKFDGTIEENLGMFEPLKEKLGRIQKGFSKAVEQEVKSERTKTELITNVSHDLKTPLTAIITYVNLLKQENLTKEERDSYLQVLDGKSMRLKELIEDLFEISKANSGTVSLNLEPVDLVSLIKQVRLELSDKIEDSGIDFKMNLPEERVELLLDSQKTYRIFENLMVNITKYGMSGTRAYIRAVREENGMVCISLRNVSAQELTVTPQELMERFTRGDSSRSTEGSGLGLAIAKSFVEAQGGSMKVEIEGDIFKVLIWWKEEKRAEETQEETK